MGPSFLIMVRVQLIALLYWPSAEFMNRVLTTSTGEATTVVQKPAPNAAVKWHGRLSVGKHKLSHSLYVEELGIITAVSAIMCLLYQLTCH